MFTNSLPLCKKKIKMTNCRRQVPAIICPDVEYTAEYDELHLIPSSPPRRLSRSSIDLRDLELEREKTIAQTQIASESVSSIYHRFDGQIRYSGSEPITTNNMTTLENQFQMKSKDASSDETNGDSKISIPYTNNFENVVASLASIVKDNPVNVSSSSSNNSNNANGRKPTTTTTTNKKKMLASSDSDFFSLLRYNSERWKKINCFSVSSSASNNGNRPKNMIYALSDSDFLIGAGINEKNKRQNLNNSSNAERKCQAIPNKSDILNFLINQKSIDYKNLLDSTPTTDKNAPNNHHQHHHVFSGNNSNTHQHLKSLDDKDLFYTSTKKKIIESISLNGEIASSAADGKNQKNETASLPPLVNSEAHQQHRMMLNNSLSIDTVLLNMKNASKSPSPLTFTVAHNTPSNNNNSHVTPASPKSLNNDDSSHVNIPTQQQSNLIVSPEHIKKSNLSENNFLQPPAAAHFVSSMPAPYDEEKRVTSNGSSSSNGGGGEVNMKSYDVMDPVALDERSVERRKRTSSTVTYNVNVINFHADDDTDAMSGGYGKRSNSSTSECLTMLYLTLLLFFLGMKLSAQNDSICYIVSRVFFATLVIHISFMFLFFDLPLAALMFVSITQSRESAAGWGWSFYLAYVWEKLSFIFCKWRVDWKMKSKKKVRSRNIMMIVRVRVYFRTFLSIRSLDLLDK